MSDPTSGDGGRAPASAVRRLTTWLRQRSGPQPETTAAPPDQPADPPPPRSRLRPQPEDDDSVYPLF
ncbi:hypothetical protein AB0D11_23335 [Streptomyces monashensis]|uniref:hypothetical protein n=1 Tax=Streptomyces monashensis TaxID=1678012 RepID=UPI0034056185